MFLAEIQFGPILIEDTRVFVAQVVGFLLLVLVLWFVNVPMFSRQYLRGVLGDRATRVEESQNLVQRALDDTQRLHDDYADRIRNIETESRGRIDAAVREAEAARAEIIADAQQAATQIRRRAEEEIAREQTRQRILLRRQIVQIALDAAEESVRANDSEAIQHQLIQDFIARAGGNGATAPAAGTVAATPTSSPNPTQGGA